MVHFLVGEARCICSSTICLILHDARCKVLNGKLIKASYLSGLTD